VILRLDFKMDYAVNDKSMIVLAGATGNLGMRVARALISYGANVKALVRKQSSAAKIAQLQALGITICKVDFNDSVQMVDACLGASCVVSALCGLRETIVDAQTLLLNAAIKAGVPRFMPSDYSADFTKVVYGKNRNFDLRKDFYALVNKAPIAATSIFNGAFADMLLGQAPIILFKLKKVLYWGNAEQLMDFTTMDNTAAFAARAAMDSTTPRILRIAGEQISASGLVAILNEISGMHFKLFKAGNISRLDMLIKVIRWLSPKSDAIYPIWQGMQYLRDMFSGCAKLENNLDNKRYSEMQWTGVKQVLLAR
jgi:nucleoside-diphosphate-sugar epimerase